MMRARRQALPTRRAPHPRERRKRRRGTILLVLCCYAISATCLALGYALGDWRLVAGGVAGLGVERKVTDRWSVFGEYEYRGFDKKKVTDANGFTSEATPEHHSVKLGVNFSF